MIVNLDNQHFIEWMSLKRKLKNINQFPVFKEGSIWWASVGENIGIEINGKSKSFSRPVLIFKKLSAKGFMGIPLTTQLHNGSWYVQFMFQERRVCAAISQARILSAARLSGPPIGYISKGDMIKIKKAFFELYISSI